APPEPSTTVPQLHQDLFVDEGIVGRGHRINILDDDWREVGVGVVSGGFTVTGPTSQVTYNAVMLTTDFRFVRQGGGVDDSAVAPASVSQPAPGGDRAAPGPVDSPTAAPVP